MRFVIGLLLFVFCHQVTQAQNLVLRGHIIDADTEEGIPFANVLAKDINVGVSCDEFGQFVLKLPSKPDSLIFSAVGYKKSIRAVKDTSYLLVKLSPDDQEIKTFVFVAEENPALRIIRGMIDNKKQNRLKSLDVWQREDYLKTELDLTNLDNKIRKSRLLEPFNFVFSGVDSASDEKPFLPVYVSEQIFNTAYRKGEGGLMQTEIARRTSGVENPTAIEAIQKVQNDLDIYDNYLYIIDKSFVSPFCDEGLLFYEYYLLDSANMDGDKCYKIKFKPRRKGETTFTGECWIADTSFAIVQTRMYMSDVVNINLIDRIIIFQDFSKLTGDRWLPAKQRIVIDFVALEKSPGFIIRKTLSSQDYRLANEALPANAKAKNYTDPASLIKPDAFWLENRHDSLTKTELQVYKLMDTLESLPVYHTYVDWIRTFISGYKEVGYIELGPLAGVYSNNPVEGNRVSAGVWTSRKFSKKIQFGGYVAYGFLDDKFKGGADATWLIKNSPRTVLNVKWRDDITSNHENSEVLTDASLFSGVYRRPVPFKLMRVNERKVSFEQSRAKGLSYKISFLNLRIDPYGGVLRDGGGFNYKFLPDPEGNPGRIDTTVNSTELIFKLRYAPGEQYFDDAFSRTVLTNRKPAIEFTYVRGLNGFGGDYNYNKFIFNYKHWTYLNPFGWINYSLRAGYVQGQAVPFLLLEVAPGNETYFYSFSGFNAVNRYEFVSDKFASFHVTHHFEGLLLNHIPLMRKLHWREVAVFRGMWGGMSRANREHNALNAFDPTLTNSYMGFRTPFPVPYLETGVGVENIFKVLRFDVIWRLNYLDHVQASRVSFRAGFYFAF